MRLILTIISTGVVWLVAVVVGAPMWHVQRLEVGSGLGPITHCGECPALSMTATALHARGEQPAGTVSVSAMGVSEWP